MRKSTLAAVALAVVLLTLGLFIEWAATPVRQQLGGPICYGHTPMPSFCFPPTPSATG